MGMLCNLVLDRETTLGALLVGVELREACAARVVQADRHRQAGQVANAGAPW